MKVTGASTGAAAFLVVVFLVPVIGSLSMRWKLFDLPGPLKTHTQPIPRLGGIAIAGAILLGILLSGLAPSRACAALISAAGLIFAVGLLDDIRGTSPALRLVVQAAAGVALWLGSGQFSIFGSLLLGLFFTVIIVVVFINAMNLLDGSDGVAAGVAGIDALSCAVLFAQSDDALVRSIAWSLAGACAGFLIFNLRAKIYLGDSGSTLLGLALSFVAIESMRPRSTPASSPVFFLLAAGLPLLDAGIAVARRLRLGRSPLQGDRRHFYDLLRARGLGPRAVALVCYGITGVLSVVAWATRNSPAASCLAAVLCMGALLAVEVRLGALRGDDDAARVRASPARASRKELQISFRP